MDSKKVVFCWLMILVIAVFASAVMGQTQPQDVNKNLTAKTAADSSSEIVDLVELDGDIILDEINIDAIIEKPRVSILTKRIDPEFGELEFVARSFDRELKSAPQKLMIEDDRLFLPNKIKPLNSKENADSERSSDK